MANLAVYIRIEVWLILSQNGFLLYIILQNEVDLFLSTIFKGEIYDIKIVTTAV